MPLLLHETHQRGQGVQGHTRALAVVVVVLLAATLVLRVQVRRRTAEISAPGATIDYTIRPLFGIPARTGDNFLHSYAQLRIGARLINGAGDEIAFLRRKGQAKTLRGPDDETVLEDEALAPFLGGGGAEMS